MTRLIDADNFKTRLEHEAWGRGHVELLRARDIADEPPTVDAVPVRHGKWENSRPDAPMFGFYYCSLCGRKRTSPQDRYCPNCGARMDEE